MYVTFTTTPEFSVFTRILSAAPTSFITDQKQVDTLDLYADACLSDFFLLAFIFCFTTIPHVDHYH